MKNEYHCALYSVMGMDNLGPRQVNIVTDGPERAIRLAINTFGFTEVLNVKRSATVDMVRVSERVNEKKG